MIRRRCGSTSGADCSPRRAPTAAPADTATTIWIACSGISELVAQGINIAGIAQILHLEHRNTELESDNSHLSPKTPDCDPRSRPPQKEDGTPMTIYLDDIRLPTTFPPPTPSNSSSPPTSASRTPGSIPAHVANLLAA